ncbi:MAG: hypothetical protein R2932_34580 [Caldilineaceae bacterium]
MSTLPALLIGLFAGVWIDRYRRRPLLLIANIGQALLLIAITGFALSGWLRMELLYLFAFALAAFRLFFDIAYHLFADAHRAGSPYGRQQQIGISPALVWRLPGLGSPARSYSG